MVNKSVNIVWYGVPCHCHCQHCLVNSGQKISKISYERAQRIAIRFIKWRDTQITNNPCVSFAVGYSTNFNLLEEHHRFLRNTELPAHDFLQVGGLQQKSNENLAKLIDSFVEAGINKIGLSFYGINSTHDTFAGRSGDFNFLLDIAREWADRNLKHSVVIFLRREYIQEIPKLIHNLEHIPVKREDIYLRPFGYKGQAKFLEEERPSTLDLTIIPEEDLKLFFCDQYKTEEEWLQLIKSSRIPEKEERHYFIPIWEENIDRLETTSPDIILSVLRESHSKYISSMPPFETLASLYSNQSGQRLYKLEDLECKWRDMYIQNHSEISKRGQFDELSECVIVR